jgi:hypothetical protein
MHDKTKLLEGDHASISIIYRNLTGQNPVSPGYTQMINEKLELIIEPSKLWIGKQT